MSTAKLTPTDSMKWLLKREFWEHKGSMFWAPVVVAGLIVALLGAGLSYGLAQHGLPMHMEMNGRSIDRDALATAMPAELRDTAAHVASGMYLASAAPLLPLLAVVVFFYCLGALYDERRDRSILFWKSLPVSDGMTVLSKVITAAVVAPVLTIGIATVSSLALLFIAGAALSISGVNLFGAVLTSPDLYLSPLRLLALLPVYAVWALPTLGWLLLVSSWARTKPFLWAIGVPVVTVIACASINGILHKVAGMELVILPYVKYVVSAILTGVVPGAWFASHPGLLHGIDPRQGVVLGELVSASYASLLQADAWIGAALGAAMLFGAVRLRRWRDEG